jgi:hypothetical protein
MKVVAVDGVRFELHAETVADQQLVDAMDFVRHVWFEQPIRERAANNAWCNTGCVVLVDRTNPHKLVADASRQIFSAAGELLRLNPRDTARDSHVGSPAADPQLQETLAAMSEQLQLVGQALRVGIEQQEAIAQSVRRAHVTTSEAKSVGPA